MILNKLKKFFLANFKLFSIVMPIIILSWGYFYLLKPKFNYLEEIGGLTLQSLKQSLQVKKEYLRNLERLKITYNNLTTEDKEKLDQILNQEKDIPNLFVHFENLVNKNEMELSAINFTEGSSEGMVGVLNVDLFLTGGNYQILKKFLDTLEKDIKIMDIDSISFSKEGYNLSLRTYYLDKSGN